MTSKRGPQTSEEKEATRQRSERLANQILDLWTSGALESADLWLFTILADCFGVNAAIDRILANADGKPDFEQGLLLAIVTAALGRLIGTSSASLPQTAAARKQSTQ